MRFFKRKNKKNKNKNQQQEVSDKIVQDQAPQDQAPQNQSAQDQTVQDQVAKNLPDNIARSSSHDDNVQSGPTKEAPSTEVGTNAADDAQLQQKLNRTQANFGQKMKQIFALKKKIDEDLFEDLETTLLMSDVGANATMEIMEQVRKSLKRRNLSDADAVLNALKEQLTELALKVEQPLVIAANKKPFVILVVGVNGVGKTTTIAKLARRYKAEGHKVMLAAGDTFRAAAVEQLKTWGEREDIAVMAQKTGADSASVIFDAMTSAKARGIDVLIADTAGRLHTQANLMQELAKITRVIKKNDESAPHETLIVIDGGTGQNAISQVRAFNEANKLTGLVITKLDGTPKGGVLFNLANEFGIPVRYIGVGERSSDLKPYRAKDFVTAILD